MPADPIQLVLTQDADGAATWRDALAASGIACWHWPAFEIHALSDQAVLDRFLDGLLPRPGDPALLARIVVLPSPAAVRVLAGALSRLRGDWPAGVWGGVPGAGTAQVFRQCLGEGMRLLCPPPPWQDGAHLALEIIDALWAEKARRRAAGGQDVGTPDSARGGPDDGGTGMRSSSGRAEGILQPGRYPPVSLPARLLLLNRPDGRTDWLGILRDAGVEVHCRPVYQVRACRAMPHDMPERLAAWRSEGMSVHWLIGASQPLQTVAGWLECLPDPLRLWALRQPLWLPHPRLEVGARGLGFAMPRVYHDRQQLIERLQSGEV